MVEVDPDDIECRAQIRAADNPGFTEESLNEFAEAIKRDGQFQPAVIMQNPDPASPYKYVMGAGERRLRACRIAGIKLKCIIRNMSEQEFIRLQRAENIQRENLTQLEIATALSNSKKELGSLEAVAREWKKSINWVSERINYLRVVEADGAGSQAVKEGLTADITTITELARLEKQDQEAASEVLAKVKEDPSINLRKLVRDTREKINGRVSKLKSEEDYSSHPEDSFEESSMREDDTKAITTSPNKALSDSEPEQVKPSQPSKASNIQKVDEADFNHRSTRDLEIENKALLIQMEKLEKEIEALQAQLLAKQEEIERLKELDIRS
ncbi:ParB/RepB/Spo0J family partition protein [Pseudomonas asuensis]